MLNKLKALITEEQGQGMTEYGLVLGIIAVGAVVALVAIRGQITTLFQNAQTAITDGTNNSGQ